MRGLIKRFVHLTPKKLRAFIYSIPYVGFRLKRNLESLFSTPQPEWFTFNSGLRQGMKMKLKLPEENEFFLETHDPEITRLLCRFIQPGQAFFDIGAHIGYYSLLASRLVGSQGSIFAFEPSPQTVLRLEEHVSENNCTNIQVLPLGIGDQNGNHEFLEFGASTLNALVLPEDQVPLARQRKGIALLNQATVMCRTLDSLLKDRTIAPPDFVKIDVEGFEFNVIQGMEKILDEVKPNLLIELHHPQAVASIPGFLQTKGYDSYRIDHGQPQRISMGMRFEDDQLRQGVNILFLPDDSF